MKTTLDIPDALLEEARSVARAQGTTLRSLVTDGLRAELAGRSGTRGSQVFQAPVFGGSPGLQPGVDLSNWDEVRSIAYGRWGG